MLLSVNWGCQHSPSWVEYITEPLGLQIAKVEMV
jgi:hypothetical protein